MDKLQELRNQIDELDDQLLDVLCKRLQVVSEVGKIKKERMLPPLDASRWAHVLEDRLQKADMYGLKREFVKTILDTIHSEALRIEKSII
ncbi:MAG: chorismate mutase [Candidatus Roizmanbacteria bacterium]